MKRSNDLNEFWVIAALAAIAVIAFLKRSAPSLAPISQNEGAPNPNGSENDGNIGLLNYSLGDGGQCITLYVWENGAYRPALFCENADGQLVRVRAAGGLGKAR